MRWLLALLLVSGCSCGEDLRGRHGTFDPTDRTRLDAGSKHEDGGPSDAGPVDGSDADGGSGDAASGDAGTGDGGGMSDAGGMADAGVTDGGGMIDAGGSDGGGASDAGADGGAGDGGPLDGGPADSGVVDAGAPDSGTGTGDLFIEISYTNAFSPQSPSWTYSNTPGWSASDWSFTGGGCCAEAWDRFNNMTVGSDPIGQTLHIHSSAQLQLMFGLSRLTSYSSVTVELFGRSRATSSQVIFTVSNPANGCGVSGLTMDQDWTPDLVVVDMSPCLQPGSNLQAIRVDPTGGSSSMALIRMRLTIHGAVF